MKAGVIDLGQVTFTFDEVMTIVGEEIDLESKYEKPSEQTEVAIFEWCEDDSDEVFGTKLEFYANQV